MKWTLLMATAMLALGYPAAAQTAAAQPIGITRAVALAEQALKGHAVEAELDAHGGRLVYEVELLAGNRLHEILIDARTGKLLAKAPARVESFWRNWFDSDWDVMTKSVRPLAPRLAALERQSGGTVREVSFDVEGGIPLYEIEIATAAGETEVHIDARSGERLTIHFDD